MGCCISKSKRRQVRRQPPVAPLPPLPYPISNLSETDLGRTFSRRCPYVTPDSGVTITPVNATSAGSPPDRPRTAQHHDDDMSGSDFDDYDEEPFAVG